MHRTTTLITGLAVGAAVAGGAVLASAQESMPPDPLPRPGYSAGSEASPERTASPTPEDTPPPSTAEPTPDDSPPSAASTPEPTADDTPRPSTWEKPEEAADAGGARDSHAADNDGADSQAPPVPQARTQVAGRKALTEACKKRGWQTLEPRTVPDQAYRNQGDCVSDIASQGRSRQARLGG